ncbi:MAG: histidine kinase [Urechidicola sp.]|nr:histidine kinase [Urechidicola sp.]
MKSPNNLEETFLWSLIFLLFILSFIFWKRSKALSKRIRTFEENQKKSDKEIYVLHQKKHQNTEIGKQQEKLRISEELHDGVVSKLYGIRMKLEFQQLQGTIPQIADEFIVQELQSLEKEIRSITHSLNNYQIISNTSLLQLINDLVKRVATYNHFKYDIKSDSYIDWESLKENVKINCYRIIQESIQNIMKHSKATFVSLEFVNYRGCLNILIKDNGIGFDINNQKKGIGLENIESRTKRMGGVCAINSNINLGTSIHIEVPL